jgi:regulator of CtrA degradation
MTETAAANPFVERAYQDTYDLLVAVRDYISGSMREEAEALQKDDNLQLTYALSQITRQLTDVMAWLMLQKAVGAGELSPEDADVEPAASLESLNESRDDMDNAALGRLPLTARGLIDRARRITALVEQLSRKPN